MNALKELKPHDFIFENTDVFAWQGVDLPLAVKKTGKDLSEMPYVIRIFLENLLRSHLQGKSVSIQEIDLLFHWSDNIGQDVPLFVTRVI
ncbi:MAG: hypothetical protein ACKVPZ_04415, partial [Burkholderiaceae bacterium]